MIRHLCVIGVGLIGGSLARALRENNACEMITGCSRSESHLQRAKELGVIDDYSTDVATAVKDADMIVVSVPLRSMQPVFEQIDGAVSDDAIITDVGSAKSSVEQAARSGLVNHIAQFVPGHPIAGTEKSGVEASFAELFQGSRVILTPMPENRDEQVDKVKAMWEAAGAHIKLMGLEHHDEVLAATSHLPHILAFSLVETLATMSDRDEIFEYAAGGFRDFSRIASSDPVMWRDICIENQDAILKLMDRYMDDLKQLQDSIRNQDQEKIESSFRRAKEARDRYTLKKKTR